MTENYDDIVGIFDNATILDFTTKSSAFSELFYPTVLYPDGQIGAEAFDTFIKEQLHLTGYAFHASDGQINPVATLGSPTMRRTFAPDDDETVGQFVQRLAREARDMKATWFFVQQITLTAWFNPEEQHDYPSDAAEAVAAVGGASVMTNNLYWYADRCEGDDIEARHGVIEILASGTKLGRVSEAIPQESTIYGAVLRKGRK